jgi:DNA-binding CsgD family transcriptional regulator
VSGLGDRETEIVRLIAAGQSSKAVAERFGISTATVEAHRRNIMKKLGLPGVADLTRWAVRNGLVNA